ncbi:hypothetical protein AXG93_3086s1020 [Marchantia polymorpha subsp. ruderalis]|uniref:Uncharacterized protein n=1 Tax=Marchantia polymorpha subsp. ruderalis TaxID=1480154 RepID=A0A176VXB3_MARPO|nr:hypothetical protein AXG93_3086s1020 [Marchantia polymorpha subsp. ruderalis]
MLQFVVPGVAVLELKSDKGTEEKDDTQADGIPRRATRGPVRMEVVMVEEGSERHLAKRHKVVEASGEGRRPEVRMARTDVMHLRTSNTRARPKKKANRKVVVSKSLEGSVAMTERATSTMDEDTREEVNLWTARVGSLGSSNEDPIEKDVELSE